MSIILSRQAVNDVADGLQAFILRLAFAEQRDFSLGLEMNYQRVLWATEGPAVKSLIGVFVLRTSSESYDRRLLFRIISRIGCGELLKIDQRAYYKILFK